MTIRATRSVLFLAVLCVFSILVMAVSGVTETFSGHPVSGGIPLDGVKNLIRIPLVKQNTDYTCGVAALQSVLFYYDSKAEWDEMELAKLLKAEPKQGVLTKDMIEFVKPLGFSVTNRTEMTLNDLRQYIDARTPVMVLLQAWPDKKTLDVDWKNLWEEGHFVVAIGYDDSNFYFMDPTVMANFAYIPNDELLDRWHDLDGGVRVYQMGLIISKDKSDYSHNIAKRID